MWSKALKISSPLLYNLQKRVSVDVFLFFYDSPLSKQKFAAPFLLFDELILSLFVVFERCFFLQKSQLFLYLCLLVHHGLYLLFVHLCICSFNFKIV